MLSKIKRDWGGDPPSTLASRPSSSQSQGTRPQDPIDLDSDEEDEPLSWPQSPEAPKPSSHSATPSFGSRVPSKTPAVTSPNAPASSVIPSSSANSSTTELSPRSRRRRAMGCTPIDASSSLATPTFVATANGTKRPVPTSFEVENHLVSSKRKASAQSDESEFRKPKKSKKKEQIKLSDEQKKVLDMVVNEGQNVFFTGSAGTGKSVLLREIIKSLRLKYASRSDAVAVTASTGIAACNVGGTTLHSFAGIGLGLEPAEKLVAKIRKSQKHLSRWTRTKVLIIDEVSMVDGDLFDKLAKIGTIIRGKHAPFGGIQLVVTGDFFQLPPVSRSEVKFAFEARMWKESIACSVNLTQVFRQKDATFVEMLTQMRFGQLDDHSTKEFRKLARPVDYEDGIMPTELYPRREDVDHANKQRLDQLHTQTMTYASIDKGSGQADDILQKELNNLLAVPRITLKINAQVMLIKNLDDELVNGSIGIVTDFFSEVEAALRAREGDWEDPGRMVDEDGAPVAMVAPPVKRTSAQGGAEPMRWPMIRFSLAGGGTREQLIMPEEFKIDEHDGTVKASRQQLPLILSWAMSIHKSQGQTLPRVKVDLRRIFEKGQAYVALSRAVSLDNLQVLNFEPSKVMCHAKVVKFTHTLQIIR